MSTNTKSTKTEVKAEVDLNLVDVEFDGQTWTINQLDVQDPTYQMLQIIGRLQLGEPLAIYEFIEELGINARHWRLSQVNDFMQAMQAELEMSLGEASGSDD